MAQTHGHGDSMTNSAHHEKLQHKLFKTILTNNTWGVTTDADYKYVYRYRIRLEKHDEHQKKNYSVPYCTSLHSVYSGWGRYASQRSVPCVRVFAFLRVYFTM